MEDTYPQVEFEESEQVLNIKSTLVKNVENSDNQVFLNVKDYQFKYNNTICFSRNNLIILRETEEEFFITRYQNRMWHDFLRKLKEKDNKDWLTVLTTASEIYNYEMFGFSGVPQETAIRKKEL
jgi:FPC/CPF motif-containing protein YcgG